MLCLLFTNEEFNSARNAAAVSYTHLDYHQCCTYGETAEEALETLSDIADEFFCEINEVYLAEEGVQEVTVLLKSLLPYYFLDHFVMSAFL